MPLLLKSAKPRLQTQRKNVRKNLWWLAVLVGFSFVPTVVSAKDPIRKPVEFAILQLNDVYEIEPSGDPSRGGLSRVAAIRRNLVEKNPRTFTILSGDTLSPSPLGSAVIDGDELAGRQMVSVLSVMGLDFATFGNHEFDLKKDQLRQRIRESTFTWVSSNVLDSGGRPLPGVPRDIVMRIADEAGNEVRVGFIGLSIDSTRPEYVRFEDPISAAKQAVRRLRDSCDIVIALTHLPITQDRRLAAAVPQIHLILGGHEHQHSYECLASPQRYSAPIAKADSNAKTVWVHELAFDTETRRLCIRSWLESVANPVAEPGKEMAPEVVDHRTDRLVKFWKERCYRGLKETFGYDPAAVIAHADFVLDGLDSSVRFRSTNLTDLIAEAMKAKVADAVAAIYNSGSIRIDDLLGPGDIRVYDVFRVLPYEGKIVRVELSGQLLIDLLTAGSRIPDEGGFLQTTGIAFDARGEWRIGGEPIGADKPYVVAMSAYLLQGNESIYGDVRDPATINGRLKKAWDMVPDREKTLNTDRAHDDREIRRALMDYMKRGDGHIRIPPKRDVTERKLPTQNGNPPAVEVDVEPAPNRTIGAPAAIGDGAAGAPR
jgi:5'-nucleotidase